MHFLPGLVTERVGVEFGDRLVGNEDVEFFVLEGEFLALVCEVVVGGLVQLVQEVVEVLWFLEDVPGDRALPLVE